MRDGAAIAAAFGGKRNGKGWNFRCPCHEDRSPSASIRNDGLVTCFAGCRREDVLAKLDELGFTDDRRRKPASRKKLEKLRLAAIKFAQQTWNELSGSPDTYLRYRGITLPAPPCLRAWILDYSFAAAVTDRDEVITAVHLKSGKRCAIDGWMGDGSVMLHPPEGGCLGLAEGIEDALSVTQLSGVPCWATIGAGRLDAVWVPGSVEKIWLFGDNDEAGREAVERAVKRFTRQEGRAVKVCFPPDGFKDWNEYLKNG